MVYWGLVSWLDLGLIMAFWAITALGITVGYHRYFTHGSFKTNRAVKITLGVRGSMALEGSINQWVAKGLLFAHMGWLFSEEQATVDKYAPDIRDDADIQRINSWFKPLVAVTITLPGVIGGLVTWSWIGFLAGMFCGGFVRIAFVHHVTWSINSICHVFGKRPFKSRDISSNVARLAIPSFGESWHNEHHADPTCARRLILLRKAALTLGLKTSGICIQSKIRKQF